MSKGIGKLQREIIELFENNMHLMFDSLEITAIVHELNAVATVTESQAVSTRRALRGLAKRKLIVDMGRGWRDGRRRWATPEQAERHRDRVRRTFGPSAVP